MSPGARRASGLCRLAVALCAARPAAACPPPPVLLPPDPAPRVAAALSARALPVLLLADERAVLGPGDPGASPGVFAQGLRAGLLRAHPGLVADIVAAGRAGAPAAAQLPLLRAALARARPALVIWQAGTAEALRAVSPDAMRGVLLEGARAVRDAGADLVLMDLPYTRALEAATDLGSYDQAIAQVAVLAGTGLFQRSAIMEAWNDAGLTPRPPAMEACLGEVLAARLGVATR